MVVEEPTPANCPLIPHMFLVCGTPIHKIRCFGRGL
ncbi:hypothetical protein LEMLEM_LOCUS12277 [Lemmus lemmus]